MKICQKLQMLGIVFLVGCVNVARISDSPCVMAMRVDHGEVLEECVPDEHSRYLYDDGFIRVRMCAGRGIAIAEVQSVAETSRLADAINACLCLGVRKIVMFYSGLDGATTDECSLELCALPLCPRINATPSRKSLVFVDVVRGDRIIVNGEFAESNDVLDVNMKRIKASNPKAEVFVRADRMSHAWSLRKVCNACFRNGIWDVFLIGRDSTGQCTVCPVNVPCPGK